MADLSETRRDELKTKLKETKTQMRTQGLLLGMWGFMLFYNLKARMFPLVIIAGALLFIQLGAPLRSSQLFQQV